jgi:Family of unknown function (DUF5681)
MIKNGGPETPPNSERDDYEVGYKKPPEHSRFQKGQSGNTRGRPKASKNLKTETIEELSETVKVRIGDRQVRVSKHRALMKILTLKAMKGDMRALTTLLNLVVQIFGLEGLPPDAEIKLTSEERAALELFEKQLREITGGASSNEAKGEEVTG